MHRIRVGLTGLACVFLLVMLSAALLRATSDPASDNMAVAANAAAPNDSLAQLGVAPGAGASVANVDAAAPEATPPTAR